MVCVDAVLRQLPGALGHPGSAVEESFSEALEGLPEYPHYTRPADFRGWSGARDPALGPPRGDPPLAPGAGARARRAARRRARRALGFARAPACYVAAPSFCHEHRHRQHRARPAAPGPGLPGRRSPARPLPRDRGHAPAHPGLRGRRDQAPGHGARETFTVRKQSFGVGVERTFPLHSPKIERIEVAARGDVRRAKLYYLRDRVGKAARVRERGYVGPEEIVEPGLLYAARGRRAARGRGEVERGARASRRRRGRAEAAPRRRRGRAARGEQPRLPRGWSDAADAPRRGEADADGADVRMAWQRTPARLTPPSPT